MIKRFEDGSLGFINVKSPEEFQTILEDFNSRVQKGIFQKINYETYKKWKKNTDVVRIMGHQNSDVIDVHVNGIVYCFMLQDYSFGEYLFYNVLNDEEAKILMTEYTNNKPDDYWLEYKYPTNLDNVAKIDVSKTYGYYYDDLVNTKIETEKAYLDPNALELNGIASSDVNIYSPAETAHVTTVGEAISSSSELVDISLKNLKKAVEEITAHLNEPTESDANNRKENDTMKFVNFEFGPVTTDKVRMSMYGMAVRNAEGNYVAYDSKTNDLVNVDILNFDGSKFLFKIPVAIKDVKPGDVVIHMRKPMIVLKTTDKFFSVVDVYEGDAKNIMPTKSPFGFNFMTKIVSLMDMCGGTSTATEDAPFGNMLPFLMMNEGSDMDPMMMMLMMGGKMDMSNPMMMYFLMKDDSGKMDDLLPLMFLMNGTTSAPPLTSTVPAMFNDPAIN